MGSVKCMISLGLVYLYLCSSFKVPIYPRWAARMHLNPFMETRYYYGSTSHDRNRAESRGDLVRYYQCN